MTTSYGGSLERRTVLKAGAVAAAAASTGLLSSCAFAGSDAAPAASGAASSSAPASTIKPEIDGDLVYFNWADYVEPSLIDSFAKKHGIKVVQANFDSYDTMTAKLESGNKYDIVFPGAKEVATLSQGGVLQPIDPQRLPNAAKVFAAYPRFASPWYDPGSRYSVPYTLYKTGMAWRNDKVSTMTGSWKDMWNSSASGRIFMFDDRDETLGVGALLSGYDVNTSNPDELSKITDLLVSQKPYLRGYSTDDVNNMLNGNAWIHHMWSGDFISLLGQAKDASVYSFQVGKEGTPVGNDTFAIPANAQHPGTAMLFIDHVLETANAKTNIGFLGYRMLVPGTEDAYAAVVGTNKAAGVTEEEILNGIQYKQLDQAATQARNAAWTQVKGG